MRFGPFIALAIASFGWTGAARGAYDLGFTWNRQADWVDGTLPGESWAAGNPARDAIGHRVWSAETFEGGGDLTSGDPWYTRPPRLLVWDDDWFDIGRPVWARGDDVVPPIGSSFMTHSLPGGFLPHAPAVRWTNPAGNGITVDVTGELVVEWSGEDGVGADVDTDVVIVRVDASDAGSTTVVFSDTLSNPLPGEVGVIVTIPVDIQDIAIDAGDAILVGHRGRTDPGAHHWVNLLDGGLQITLASVPPDPCPGDIDGDGSVSIADLLFVLTGWGSCP